ncbi:MAG: DUF6876 family protein [Myxococcaceae bacterium]
MKKFDPTQLSYFTGTEKYYSISRRHLLTDGTKYLAEKAECFWLMDAIASHLSEIGTEDWFVQVRMTVNSNRATMIYEDGSGGEHARQDIPPEFDIKRAKCLIFIGATYKTSTTEGTFGRFG